MTVLLVPIADGDKNNRQVIIYLGGDNMAVIIDGKIVVDGNIVGTVREYEDAPRRYELGGNK